MNTKFTKINFEKLQVVFFFCLFFISCKSARETQTEVILKNENFSLHENSKNEFKQKTFSYSRNLFLEKHKTDDATFDVPCKILSRGNYSAIKQTRVIRSLSELDKNLLRHLSLENIDFEKNTLVLACAGRFSTGGYSLQLQSARLHEKTLHLHFVVLYPNPRDMVTMAITYPYAIVQVGVSLDTKIEIEIIGEHLPDDRFLRE